MPTKKTGSNGELTLLELEALLSDIQHQPKWREESAKCDDYYDNHQLTTDRLARMEKLGVPPCITNLIAPAINTVLGMEAKTRTDWRVTHEDEAQDVPENVLDAMNAKLNEAERESRADRAISDAYAGQVKAGLGWVEVSKSTDALAYPYRVSTVHREEMFWDWRAKQPDLADARFLVRKRMFDHDVLQAMLPEHAKLIDYAVNDKFGRNWQDDTESNINTELAMAANIERITSMSELEWRNSERKRAALFEVWYRRWVRGKVVRVKGKVIPFDTSNEKHLMAAEMGLVQPYGAAYGTVRVAFYLGCHRLYDVPTPYKHRHFPYVPFWGFREGNSGVPYGMIRGMISPQDVVNSADSKMHWMLNSRRLRADSDAIDTNYNTWASVRENLARADSVVLLDPSKPNSRFREENDNGLNAQQFQRRAQAANDIQQTAGVYRSMMGQESNASSGLAINSLIEQGNITLAEINDNYQFARRQVGELLFSMVREDLLHGEIPVAVKKEGKKTITVLNANGGQENRVDEVAVKVVLEDVPSTPAFRAQQLHMMTEITKSLPPQFQAAIIDMVIGLTDAPQKDKIIERLRRVGGIGKNMTPEEQEMADQAAGQAQAAERKMLEDKAMAEIDLLKAKIKDIESGANKKDSEKVLRMVEAMYAALQAGQVVATTPGVAPVADEILKGAGFSELPDTAPVDIEATAPDIAMPQPQQQAGMMQGIEP